MDYAFERDWQALVKRMMDRFGEEPDVTSMVFAVGLQEAGQGARRYKKDEKMDLMHVGVCTLLVILRDSYLRYKDAIQTKQKI